MSSSSDFNTPVDMEKLPVNDIEKQSPPGSSGNQGGGQGKKGKIRTGDKDNEEIVIPKNRIFVVFIGLMLTTFLAALDQTIVCIDPRCVIANVATALPTIIEDLKGGQDYAWVGTAYLLASTAFTPIYGRGRYCLYKIVVLTLVTSLDESQCFTGPF